MKNYQVISNRNCPLCGTSSQNSSVVKKSIVICNSCSLLYNYKIFLSEHKYWTDFTFDKKVYDYDLSRIKYFKYLFKYICRKIIKKNKGSLLDIGCGPGILLKIFSSNGWEVEGVEISKKIVKYAQEYSGCNVYLGDIKNLNILNKYDVVLLMDVFRYLRNPFDILKACFKLLKNDGAIIIRELNARNFLNKKRIYANKNCDLQFLSKKTAKKFMERVGIKMVYFYPSPMSLLTLPIIKKMPPPIRNLIMIVVNKIIHFLYILSGKKLIITPEILIVGRKSLCKK